METLPHFGDPCVRCNTPHDDVEPSPCMAAPDARRFRALVGSFKAVPGAWNGDAYDYHPHGVIRRGIIFTDHHNTNNYVSASVILDPHSGIIPAAHGRNASINGFPGHAVPRPASGGTLPIYSNGSWLGEDGPWRGIVIEVLADLAREIAGIEERERQARADAAAAHEAARAESFAKARRAIALAEGGHFQPHPRSGLVMADQAIYDARLAEMRERFKLTPYRRGIAAGQAYVEIFWAWNERARTAQDWSGRPEAPTCPYTNRHSASSWLGGFRREVAQGNRNRGAT